MGLMPPYPLSLGIISLPTPRLKKLQAPPNKAIPANHKAVVVATVQLRKELRFIGCLEQVLAVAVRDDFVIPAVND